MSYEDVAVRLDRIVRQLRNPTTHVLSAIYRCRSTERADVANAFRWRKLYFAMEPYRRYLAPYDTAWVMQQAKDEIHQTTGAAGAQTQQQSSGALPPD
jgi:hypothetical protein